MYKCKIKLLVVIYILINLTPAHAASQKAILAGGCFWCLEPPFESTVGVISVVSGYTGGKKVSPSYEEVSRGDSGHIEAVEVTFNDDIISYEKILEIFWRNIDPLDSKGQFCDKGEQYTSGIFFLNQEQKISAEKSFASQKDSRRFKNKTIVTFLKEIQAFYPAEDYHQDYYKKNPLRYKYYRYSCGRDKRLKEIWQ